MPKSLTTLQKLNIEASIEELQKDWEVLSKYRDKEFTTLKETLHWLSGQILSLKEELEEDKD